MSALVEVARTGVTAAMLHPLRTLVTGACVVVVLVPYVTGTAISQGVQREAEASISSGADLYVSGEEWGRPSAIPLSVVPAVREVDGVSRVVPRILGAVTLGRNAEPAVVLGLPPEAFPATIRCVDGRLPQDGSGNDIVIGSSLARHLGIRVGSVIPPFYRNEEGERLSHVVGVFRADAPFWETRLVLTTFNSAAAIFARADSATDLLVYCRPGYEREVSTTIRNLPLAVSDGRLRIVTRSDLAASLPPGLSHREGVFQLHFMLACTVGILVLMVTSGIGLRERRREVGLLKATGWQTEEILVRSVAESSVIALGAGSLSVVLAFLWLKLANGYWIAGLFLTGVEAVPAFRVPSQLMPGPVLLGLFLSWTLIATGSLHSSWRAAAAPPRDAMR